MFRCEGVVLAGVAAFLCAQCGRASADANALPQHGESYHLVDADKTIAPQTDLLLTPQLPAGNPRLSAPAPSKPSGVVGDTAKPDQSAKDTALPFPASLWPALLMLALLAIARRFRWKMA